MLWALRWRRRRALRADALSLALWQHIAVIDPDLDANDTIGGVRLGQAVVDVGAQRLQGHAALRLLFDTRNLSAAEPTAHHHFDALGANAHRLLHGLFHCPAERDTLFELICDATRDKIRVQFRAANLDDAQAHLLLRQPFEILAQPLDTLTALANHNAWLGGVDGDGDLRPGDPLDLDARDARVGQPLADAVAQFAIFREEIFVRLIGVPARVPTFDNTQPEAGRMNFMPQSRASSAAA
jgi:hypothetical protein